MHLVQIQRELACDNIFILGFWGPVGELSTKYLSFRFFSSGNECDRSQIVCDTEASCMETSDGFDCICNEGYVGNGTHCEG